jgi:broad specificity phosphatase PhoE
VTTILFARHGETDWNRERRYQGHADEPLNELGRAQARQLAEELRSTTLSAVYSSDLRRASETADIVAAGLGLPVMLDTRLREIDVGSWQGVCHTDLDGRPWDGETNDAHRERVVAAILDIARAHPHESVLVVAHGGTLRRAQETVLGESQPVVQNCAVWAAVVEGGDFRALD